jgi:hypothetical protein
MIKKSLCNKFWYNLLNGKVITNNCLIMIYLIKLLTFRDAIRMEFYNPQSDPFSSNPIRNPSGQIQKSGDPSRSNPEFGDFFF